MSIAGTLYHDFWILKAYRNSDGLGGNINIWEPVGVPLGDISRTVTSHVVENEQRIVKSKAMAVLTADGCEELDESCVVKDPEGNVWDIDGYRSSDGDTVIVDLVIRK